MDEVEREARAVDPRSRFDAGSAAGRLGLIKEVVALANSGGGEIRLPVKEHGAGQALVADQNQAFFEAAALTDLVDSYIAPDHVEVSINLEGVDSPGHRVVLITVSPHEMPPLVFSKDGQYLAEKENVVVFRRHTVVSRHGVKAELATCADHRGWVDAAVRAERERMRQILTVAASLPDHASIQVVSESGETSSEPRVMLDRSVRSWAADPSKLLSRQDLLVLFLAQDAGPGEIRRGPGTAQRVTTKTDAVVLGRPHLPRAEPVVEDSAGSGRGK